MSVPDFSRGFLRVPTSIWMDVFCRAPLSRRQLQIVSLIIRESWGWQTRDGRPYLWTRPLPARQIATATGLSSDHIARDVKELVGRNVLVQQDRCFQFNADVSSWLPRGSAAPDLPVPTAKTAARTADLAPSASVVKTGEIEQRDVDATSRASRRDRFVRIVVGFVGSISPEEEAELRRWIESVGVAAVWQLLEPGFRRGPAAGRQHLQVLLARQRLSAVSLERQELRG